MCLVALSWQSHPRWRLLMAGNRDEFHGRPTAPLHAWPTPHEGLLAGRDLRSGGSWVGANRQGRAAVVTNVRDPLASASGPSRGQLIADYLAGSADAAAYAEVMRGRAAEYPPFNLLLVDAGRCHYLGNHPAACRPLEPGIHGMSNGRLDAPWPKTRRLAGRLSDWQAAGETSLDPLWAALADETIAPDDALPDTGVGLDLERRLSPAFIRGHDYGTRASTILAIGHDGRGWIHERRFGPDGVFLGETRLDI
ncbi:NRDE family protein [[Pseudomonas] boreopolis]|uniref:NRDE family protein n=1 Tax=Xanthomonas boreopolis TaxID=86183 RepID=UPI003DA17CAD